LLGDPVPTELTRPIKRTGQRVPHSQPRGLLEVNIDGRETFFEWVQAGHYIYQSERGTMADSGGVPLRDVYFGFDLESLLIRIDFDRAARQALLDFEALRIGFVQPEGLELLIQHPARMTQDWRVQRHGETIDIGAALLKIGIDRIAEMAIPCKMLGVDMHQPVHFYVELLEGRQSRDRAPREGAIQLIRPSADFERVMWDV
jgi:hypothetical protein